MTVYPTVFCNRIFSLSLFGITIQFHGPNKGESYPRYHIWLSGSLLNPMLPLIHSDVILNLRTSFR